MQITLLGSWHILSFNTELLSCSQLSPLRPQLVSLMRKMVKSPIVVCHETEQRKIVINEGWGVGGVERRGGDHLPSLGRGRGRGEERERRGAEGGGGGRKVNDNAMIFFTY